MIEVVTCPPDLGDWQPDDAHPYLELYGETQPRLCTLPDIVMPQGAAAIARTVGPTTIYEYFWTIGLSEHGVSNWRNRAFGDHHIGAVVELYFPRSGGWRVCEAVAAIQMLRPLPIGEGLMEKVAEYWKTVSPIALDASDLLKILPTPVSPAASTLLGVVARMHITALPPVEGFAWSVSKTTCKVDREVMDGVTWHIPATIFKLGNRLTGSIAVYFVPTRPQQNGALVAGTGELSERAIIGRARIRRDEDTWVPSPSDYLKLRIRPRPTVETKGRQGRSLKTAMARRLPGRPSRQVAYTASRRPRI